MAVKRAIDITSEQRRMILSLLRRHIPNTTVWAYGSRVKWTARPSSDLDIVAFATAEQSAQIGDLREAFEESNLPFRVDLFVWDDVPNSFRKNIEAEHVVLVKEFAANWPLVKLGDCIEINPSTYSAREAWPFVNYLDTGNITHNEIKTIQHMNTEEDKIPSRARRKAEPGDLVYSMVRPEQRHFGFLKDVPDNFLVSTGFSVIRGKENRADTRFLYYFLSQNHIVNQLQTIAEHSTSTYPAIRPTDIERLKINLPPISEQRAIAHILGTLDDKIELNQRMNKTLEEMSSALFKSWFVDFDPVHAKAEGRDTGLPKELASLFPEHFDNKAKLPNNWRFWQLHELVDQVTGTVKPLAEPNVLFEHYSIPAYDAGQHPAMDFGKNIKSNKTLISKRSILLSKLNPEFLRVWIPDNPTGASQITSTEFLVLTPKSKTGRNLLSSLFRDPKFHQKLQSMVVGTSKSHQRVPPRAILSLNILSGQEAVFEAFESIVEPWLHQTLKSRRESRILAQLRDVLLSHLMSDSLLH